MLHRRRQKLLCAFLLAVVFVLIVAMALGPALKVGSHFVVLPWRLFGALPGLSLAAPKRFIVYAMLVSSVAIAVWWSAHRSWWRTGLVALAILAVFPAGSAVGGSTPVHLPSFIASGQYRRFITPGETAIVVGRDKGEDMLWQAAAGMYFGVNTFSSRPCGIRSAFSLSMMPTATLVNAFPQDASSGSASRSTRPKYRS